MAKMHTSAAVGVRVFSSVASRAAGAGGARGTFSEHCVHRATLRGQVSQDQAMTYAVRAKAGQSMTVHLDGDAKTAFDLSGPKDRSGQAMASRATEWAGTLPDDGDYTILVFNRGAANAPFTLKISIE